MKRQIGEPVWPIEDTVSIQQGSAEAAAGERDDHPIAVLWLPDPEQRHGWREFYVRKQAPKPGAKKMGYRK